MHGSPSHHFLSHNLLSNVASTTIVKLMDGSRLAHLKELLRILISLLEPGHLQQRMNLIHRLKASVCTQQMKQHFNRIRANPSLG